MKIVVPVLLALLFSFFSCKQDQTKSNANANETSDTLLIDKTVQDEKADDLKDTLIFEWQLELCSCKGYYLRSFYSEQELKDTYDFFMRMDAGLTTSTMVFYPRNIADIDIPKFTKEYESLRLYLDTCKLVNNSYWSGQVTRQKKNLEKQYYLEKLKMEAFLNPKVLLNSDYVYDDCEVFAKALASGDEDMLLKVWKDLRVEMSKNNGYPERVMAEFQENLNSPDRDTYARIDLITFGWWNCINQHIERADYEKMAQEFEKLFVKIEKECEEP